MKDRYFFFILDLKWLHQVGLNIIIIIINVLIWAMCIYNFFLSIFIYKHDMIYIFNWKKKYKHINLLNNNYIYKYFIYFASNVFFWNLSTSIASKQRIP